MASPVSPAHPRSVRLRSFCCCLLRSPFGGSEAVRAPADLESPMIVLGPPCCFVRRVGPGSAESGALHGTWRERQVCSTGRAEPTRRTDRWALFLSYKTPAVAPRAAFYIRRAKLAALLAARAEVWPHENAPALRARRLAVRYDFSHRNSSAALLHYQSCRSQFGVFRELLSDLLDRFPAELK